MTRVGAAVNTAGAIRCDKGPGCARDALPSATSACEPHSDRRGISELPLLVQLITEQNQRESPRRKEEPARRARGAL